MRWSNGRSVAGASFSLALVVGLAGLPPPARADGPVILHPGYLHGSVTVAGQLVSQVTVRAIDTEKLYSASVAVVVPSPASSVEYTLTVEGDRDYHVVAEVRIASADITDTVTPVAGPVFVPIDGTTDLYLPMNPAFISGTISTTTNGANTIEYFQISARQWVPEFNQYFFNRTYVYTLSEPGIPGKAYALLVSPGVEYTLFAYITVNGVLYYVPPTVVTAPGAGGILDHDFAIDVTAATISGQAHLHGIDLWYAYVNAWAYDPYRSVTAQIADLTTGSYSLDLTAGYWYVRPTFNFYLPGDLSELRGFLAVPPTTQELVAGQHEEYFDFSVDPGFLAGTLSLTGANTDFTQQSYVRASSVAPSGGISQSELDPESGRHMFVVSPGQWSPTFQYLFFDYPDDPDPDLRSQIYSYDSAGIYEVAAGETNEVNLTFGTATVRVLYYVEGEETLNSPMLTAVRSGWPTAQAWGYGSSLPVTEGQAITTLFPGTYSIEAFAYVEGSLTEFGQFNVSVEEGDVVVIGGPGRPTIQVTNPTEGEQIYASKVTVEGTADDDVGIESITINGEVASFEPTGVGNEVSFAHEIRLPVIGENVITVVATDQDGSEAVALTLTVIRISVCPDWPGSRSMGFYRNHRCVVEQALPVEIPGGPVTEPDEALQVMSDRGCHASRLRSQLLVAKLNLATFEIGGCTLEQIGLGGEETVADVVAQAEGLLGNAEATHDDLSEAQDLLDEINNSNLDTPFPEEIAGACSLN